MGGELTLRKETEMGIVEKLRDVESSNDTHCTLIDTFGLVCSDFKECTDCQKAVAGKIADEVQEELNALREISAQQNIEADKLDEDASSELAQELRLFAGRIAKRWVSDCLGMALLGAGHPLVESCGKHDSDCGACYEAVGKYVVGLADKAERDNVGWSRMIDDAAELCGVSTDAEGAFAIHADIMDVLRERLMPKGMEFNDNVLVIKTAKDCDCVDGVLYVLVGGGPNE